MKTLKEQFDSASKKYVVPLTLEEVTKDEHYLPVNRYPFMLKPEKGEVGLLGLLRGRIVSGVYERVFCHTAAIDLKAEYKGNNKAHVWNPEEAKRYVADSVPGQRFLDSRGQ